MDWERSELYPELSTADLAQELFDRGLIYLVNAAVLHHHGYALGVDITDGQVTGLSLHKTPDPEGVWFDEDSTVKGRRKLREAGYLG